MAVDQHKPAHAVMAKAPYHIAYHKSKRIGVEADRTGKSFTAAGARLRLITIREGRRDKPADLAGNALTYPGGEHNVHVQGHMRPVLLGTPEREEHRCTGVHPFLELRPAQFSHEYVAGHSRSPSCLMWSGDCAGAQAMQLRHLRQLPRMSHSRVTQVPLGRQVRGEVFGTAASNPWIEVQAVLEG
jgi:hypothetical protein